MEDKPSPPKAGRREGRRLTEQMSLIALGVLTVAYFVVAFDLFELQEQQQQQSQVQTDPFSAIEWLVLLLPSLPALFDASRTFLGWRWSRRVEQTSNAVRTLRPSWLFVGACWLLTYVARYVALMPGMFEGHDSTGIAPVLSLAASCGYTLLRSWQGSRPRGLAMGLGWVLLVYLLIGAMNPRGWLPDAARPDRTYHTLSDYQTAPSDFPFKDSHDGAYPRDPFLGRAATPEARPNQNNRCTIVLSMSGGGTNSASFSWGAISELNDTFSRNGRSIIREFDYIVTASGGGLSALTLMEILREADERGDPLDQQGASQYLGSSRFFATMGLSYLPSSKLDFLQNILDGRAASRVRREVTTAFVGLKDSVCEDAYAGPLQAVPRDTPEAFEQYVTCKLTEPLQFKDVFPKTASETRLPAFIATVTAFETGHVIPILPQWMEKLGVEDIMLALPHAASRKGVTHVDPATMNYLDAVVLSMSFPGIGPVLGVTRPLERPAGKSIRRGIALADGGQSDNLGIGVGLRLGLNEAASHPVVQIVLDSSIQTSSPYLVRKYDLAEGLSKMMQNGVPLLGAARLEAELNARRLAREVLGPPDSTSALKAARNFQLAMVRLSSVMDLNQTQPTLFHALPKDGCLWELRPKLKLPLDRAKCELTPREGSPQELLGGFDSSLARHEDEVQLLVDAGREAMRRELASGLEAALGECLK